MNETHDLAERNNRLWMVGVRYHDTSWQVVRHYYVVTAADPGQALYAGRQRSGSTAERRARKGAPLDSAWCEVHEIVTDFSGERHLKRSSSLCAGTRPASRLRGDGPAGAQAAVNVVHDACIVLPDGPPVR